MIPRTAAFLAIALAGAALDLGTKAWAFSTFPRWTTHVLIPHVLSIQLTTNPGIAGGLFPSRVWAGVSVAAIPLIAFAFLRRKDAGGVERLCGALILAGAMGNGYDRLYLKSVRDFILMPFIPNFNLADAMLTGSVAVLVLIWIIHERRPVGDPGPAPAREPHDGGVGDLGRDHGPGPGRP